MKFFILGCQRSGTTLMRLVMDSHPDIKCFSEPESYQALENGYESDYTTGFHVPIWTELFYEYDSIKSHLELGSHQRCRMEHMHHELLAKQVSGWPIVFMYRNIYDVYSSMKNLNGFIQKEVIEKIEAWKDDPNRCFSKYDVDLSNPVLCAAQYFDYKNSSCEILRTFGCDVLPVSYDNFVHSPERHTKAICYWIGIPFHQDMLRHHEVEHSGVSKNGITMGNTDARRPIDTNSHHKDDLSQSELSILQRYDPWH